MFVHLHLHTQYSLLEGAIRTDELFPKVKAMGMSAVAMTDTNNLFGAVDFYLEAKKAGVKPIIGCEVFFSPAGRNVPLSSSPQNSGPKTYHLVLLVKNQKGYQNLCELVTRAYTEAPAPQKGQPAGPKATVDKDLLDRFGDGLIVLSGCLRGEIPYKLLTGDEEGAQQSAEWFKKRFGEDFYLELLDSGIPEQDFVNESLFHLAKKLNIKAVATSDCHYFEPKDAESHEVLCCIEHGRNLEFDRPKSLVPAEHYLKSPEIMRERFERFPGVCDETMNVAEKCNFDFKFKDEKGRPIYHLPNYRPEGIAPDAPFDSISYFKDEARKGLEVRFKEVGFKGAHHLKDYHARLEDELNMIEKTGFAGYFLIVADFINWAKRNSIPVGPGRGSGAGSVVAWSLRITDIDPIQFNLLFERFINPERISMPDFDVDFCQDRRGEVIDYVMRKYGSDKVSQIITFGKLQTRAAIKDVARVMGLSFADSDAITKLVPEELNITIQSAIDKEPRLKEKIENEAVTAKIIEYALSLEGLYRSAGMHAAGVIITEEPVVKYCPLFMGRDGALVIQYDKDAAEKIGLIKFDFLGLKTLTVIDYAVKLIRAGAYKDSAEAEFTLEKINYEDPKVFALISSGDTDGVFQVESSGMKDLCTRMQPSSLEDLTAINALYRPGPLRSGMVDDFIERKHGRNSIVYDVPQLEAILKETYGVIVYQEQVMQISREVAGYSLGKADLLRRAMGKKKADEMAEHREIFVKGALEKGLTAEKAGGIFDLMEKFAEYGFNKSHSAAYGLITYQTAYLKTHFLAEFMAALMATEMDNTDKITKYVADARAHKLLVLPPDVNFSQRKFSVERDPKTGQQGVRFGLEAIKGVGGAAVDSILEARDQGKFNDILDFCKRVSARKVNKKVLESLTLAGAFDSIATINRASMLASIEGLLEWAGDEQQERELGQTSLFDAFGSDEVKLVGSTNQLLKSEADWPRARTLMLEKQVLGFYVSGHPLDTWQSICEEWLGWSTERVHQFVREKLANQPALSQPQEWVPQSQRPQKPEARLAGLLVEKREVMTKKGSRMAFGQFEDLKGKIEVVFFPETYAKCAEILKRAETEAEALLLTGDIEVGESPKLLVKSLEWVAEAHRNRVQQVVLRLDPSKTTPDQLRELKKSLLQFRGKCAVRIDFTDPLFKTRLDLPSNVKVTANPQMVESINRIFGAQVVHLQ